jgi:two-component system, cell cycle sensor histidine kinase and response regulator CckA
MASNADSDCGNCARLSAELERAKAELLHARKTELLGRLAGAVAHDFNNLLTAVCGFGGILAQGLRPGDPLSDDANEIQKAGQRGTALTRQLLAFSRRRAAQPARVSLNAVVAESERMLRRLVGEPIELLVSLAPELGEVWADAGQLEQVLVNLVVNARDAMPDGGTLTIETADADAADGSACVRLTVRDTGGGIEPDVFDRLFEPFFTTKGERGNGLGLSTVQSIVRDWGGFVQVASEEGRGTAFEVWFPRLAPEAEPAKSAAASAVNCRPCLPAGRGAETVLVVEDDDLVRELACRMLEANGYAAIEARSPDEALAVCAERRAPIDVIVADVVMPRMTGLELVERLTAGRPSAKVLLISGYGGDHPLVDRAAASGRAFLQKPFAGETLLLKIRELLDEAVVA